MKKKCVLLVLLAIFLLPFTISANTVYFAVDETLDFALLEGFDVYFNDGNGLPDTFVLTPYYNGINNVDLGGKNYEGSVPPPTGVFPNFTLLWEVFETSYGVAGFSSFAGDDLDFSPLIPGVVFSVQSDDALLSISEVSLTGPGANSGVYPLPFNISEEILGGQDILLTVSNVPIPPALLLLGSGLVGIIGLRRRMTK